MHTPRITTSGTSANSAELRDVFVRRVHQLVRLGYERLNPADHAKAQEPAITGDLHVEIERVLDHPIEDWMRLYSVHDDPAENDGRRKGKRRKRIDLRIDSAFSSPRCRFRFEAKRLGKRHKAKVYLGEEGLGCFLRGDYARHENHAGMLGYVQSGNLPDWADALCDELQCDSPSYEFDVKRGFTAIPNEVSTGRCSFQSQHARPTLGRSILIDHILLKFH